MTESNSHPLVSVALCSYNGARFLEQQLTSILHQTYPNFEVVIVDDASTDNTVEIIKKLSLADSRISYQVNAENLGYNRNFEKAILLCKGEYIAISDQDDIWEADKIRQLMNAWPKDTEFIYSLSGDFYDDDFANRKPAPKVLYQPVDDLHMLVFNSPVHGHACMFKKSLINRCIPFPVDIFYDWWLSMHAAAKHPIACLPQTLTWHRVHAKNSSRTLTSIGDKKEREKQLRTQAAHFIDTYLLHKTVSRPENFSLQQYASLLKTLDGKKFSWPMFFYIMKHRKKVFHYKKKPFVFFSHVKRAIRMGRSGLL